MAIESCLLLRIELHAAQKNVSGFELVSLFSRELEFLK
jgi:hypothetical protein